MPGPPGEVNGRPAAGPGPTRRAGRPRPPSGGRGGSDYCSDFPLRRGRSANHQILAMVASTPNAAAGFTILRERSDIRRRYLDGPVSEERPQRVAPAIQPSVDTKTFFTSL